MTFYIEPINLRQWNLFDKVKGPGHVEPFLATRDMQIGDIVMLHVGKQDPAHESGKTNMSIVKIETASSVTLVLNGNTVFASDDTSYWLQGAKVIGDDGHVYGHAETIRDALCLVLAKYGGLKGNSTKETKPVKAVRAW